MSLHTSRPRRVAHHVGNERKDIARHLGNVIAFLVLREIAFAGKERCPCTNSLPFVGTAYCHSRNAVKWYRCERVHHDFVRQRHPPVPSPPGQLLRHQHSRRITARYPYGGTAIHAFHGVGRTWAHERFRPTQGACNVLLQTFRTRGAHVEPCQREVVSNGSVHFLDGPGCTGKFRGKRECEHMFAVHVAEVPQPGVRWTRLDPGVGATGFKARVLMAPRKALEHPWPFVHAIVLLHGGSARGLVGCVELY